MYIDFAATAIDICSVEKNALVAITRACPANDTSIRSKVWSTTWLGDVNNQYIAVYCEVEDIIQERNIK